MERRQRRVCARAGWRLAPAAVLMLLLCAGPAYAQQDSEGSRFLDAVEGTFDVIVLRPLGLLGVGMGSVFFVASAPFMAPAGNLSVAYDVFLYGPVEYTFLRPLGAF